MYGENIWGDTDILGISEHRVRDQGRTQRGGGSCLKAEKRGLRRNQPASTLTSQPPFLLFKPPRLRYVIMAAQAD